MGLRDEFKEQHPDFPLLEVGDVEGLGRYLASQQWLEPGEKVRGCDRAGEGNMNLTLRVRTDRRRFIVKQARPWVEKYNDIPAPWDRSHSEIGFYQKIQAIREVASRMPRLLGCDREARVMLLEDLPAARDLSDVYDPSLREAQAPSAAERAELALYLRHLHCDSEAEADPALANRAMRELNHAHMFEIPMDDPPPVDLDALEPGLADATALLRGDAAYRSALGETGARYLSEADGRCLVHGDYFPGSWLRTDLGLRIIDPEFGFFGDPELDLGFAVAHFALAGLPPDSARHLLESYSKGREAVTTDVGWIARYAAVEVMRRLVGVAQLAIPASRGFRKDLLERSRRAMSNASLDPLWQRT